MPKILKDKTMDDKLRFILNDEKQNDLFRIKLVVKNFEPTNQDLIKVPKVVKSINVRTIRYQ